MTALADDQQRIETLVEHIISRLADGYVLAETADKTTREADLREADDVHRAVQEALTMLASGSPRLLAEVVIYLLDGAARDQAAQVVAASKAAQRCLDTGMPVELRPRRS